MEQTPAVDAETAKAEIEKWLKVKAIPKSKREANHSAIETLISALSEGQIILNEDFTLTQNLLFPIGKDSHITTLTHIARLPIFEINEYLKGIPANDADARLMAYVCASTKQPKGVIAKLDTTDYSIATSVAVFFM